MAHGEDGIFLSCDPGEPASVFIGSDPSTDVAVLQVGDPGEGVQFWRRLSHAHVRGELAVRLGLAGRGFSLGPDVVVDVDIVEVPARAIRVYTSAEKGVELYASIGYLSDKAEPDLYKFGAGELAVWWDGVRYPWMEYAKQPVIITEGDYYTLHQAFMDFTRIARGFAYGPRPRRPLWGPVPFEYMNALVHRGGIITQLADMLAWMIEERIIVVRSREYYLDPARLSELGVRLFELVTRKETSEALQLMRRFTG